MTKAPGSSKLRKERSVKAALYGLIFMLVCAALAPVLFESCGHSLGARDTFAFEHASWFEHLKSGAGRVIAIAFALLGVIWFAMQLIWGSTCADCPACGATTAVPDDAARCRCTSCDRELVVDGESVRLAPAKEPA